MEGNGSTYRQLKRPNRTDHSAVDTYHDTLENANHYLLKKR
ncbi:MAG: hypothetical protein Q8P81_04575 [Nanoarchaeota archaeon]|nr:hypothetical protein [Nanoarchaeota archaeon]